MIRSDINSNDKVKGPSIRPKSGHRMIKGSNETNYQLSFSKYGGKSLIIFHLYIG